MNARAAPMYPRVFLYFAALLATALVGFWGSYLSLLPQTGLVRHFHGTTAFAWILLLITQAWLMRRRNYQLHRKLGRVSLLLAPLFVLSGLLLVRHMLAHPSPFAQAFGAQLAFVDLTTIAWFAIAYVQALRHRRDTPVHARYMASTAILVLPPALSRALGTLVPAITSFEASFQCLPAQRADRRRLAAARPAQRAITCALSAAAGVDAGAAGGVRAVAGGGVVGCVLRVDRGDVRMPAGSYGQSLHSAHYACG